MQGEREKVVMVWCANGETWLQRDQAGQTRLSYVGNLSLCSVELFCREKKIDLSILRRTSHVLKAACV